MKIISRRNPIVFLNNKFKNFESVPTNQYSIVDEVTGEIWDRNPELFKTDEVLPSLIESELIFDSELQDIRLKTDQEIINYNNNLIDLSFHRKNIKLFAPDYKTLINAEFDKTAIVMQENTGIIKEFITLEAGLIEGSFYLDFINPADVELIDDAISAGYLVKTQNPTRQ